MELLTYLRTNSNKIFLILLAFSLFFPMRHVFLSPAAFQTGAYSDFTSFSLYLSDILLVCLLFLNKNSLKLTNPAKQIATFLLALLLTSAVFSVQDGQGLSLFFLIKIAELFLAYLLFKTALNKAEIGTFLKSFLVFSVIQVLLAIIQFSWQGSLGLRLLGESQLGAQILGVAKITLNDAKFIRPYGTFPHPNLLSAFLLVGVLISQYFLFHVERKLSRLLLAVCSFVLIFGLFITFSRAALLALGVALVFLFVTWLWKFGLNKRTGFQAGIVVAGLVLSVFLLAPFLSTRTTVSDTATNQRVLYSHVGVKMIKDNLLFGVGPGTSVLHMKQYSPVALQPWEVQPIHNYFLLAAADLGIISAGILIAIFLYYLIKLIKTTYASPTNGEELAYRSALLAIFIGFLILMMFDHYFYTIQQTQFLFWIMLGLIAREVSRGEQSLPAQ